MRIPKSVPLLGHIITVNLIDPKDWQNGDDTVGLWNPETHEIQLLTGYSDSKMGQTFYHELVHACLYLMNHKLKYDEPFVDSLASLLHQAITGAKYSRRKRASPSLADTHDGKI